MRFLFGVLFVFYITFQICILGDEVDSVPPIIPSEIRENNGVETNKKNTDEIPDAPPISDNFTEDQKKELTGNAESFSFQAEVARLMDIIINSLYTQKEVFLRELISNAADALEKARFISISNPDFLGDSTELDIRVDVNPSTKTITIQDTGIGMTREDMVNNLGTVARSGTTNFLEAMAESGDLNLIGQFGVGFYSAFLVADKVTVASKNNNDPDQHIWESMIGGTFTIAKDPRGNTLKRGTRITLHLKDDSTEFLDPGTIRDTIVKFNQFVNFPIRLRIAKEFEKEEQIVDEQVPPPEEKKSNEDDAKSDDEKKSTEKDQENVKEDEKKKADEEKPKTKKVKVTKHQWEVINSQKPIWMRSKDEITREEYIEFYKAIARDTDPAAYTHFSAEGEIEFKAILYVPSHAPYDAYSSYFSAKQDAIKLYARRILVADSVYELLPKWLNFIKGVVDSDDLPLKVDRESFSQSKVINVISKKVVAKFLELLKRLSEEDQELWAKYREEIKSEDEKKN